MTAELRKTGIAAIGDMPWGTHFCHFYQTRQDLLAIVLPYLRAGLEANECCLWVSAEALGPAGQTRLRRAIPGADEHLAAGDIEILSAAQWYLKDGVFAAQRVIDAWDDKLERALARGYAGLRVAADEAWLGRQNWRAFSAYERELNGRIGEQPMLVQCAYPLVGNSAAAIFDVAHTHQFAIAERNGHWETLETPELRQAKRELERLNETLEERVGERTRELATSNDALCREMARRRQAEALQERLAAVVESSDDAIVSKDLEGRIVTWNAGAERLYGYTAAEAVGRPIALIVPPERAGEQQEIMARLKRGERIEHFETRRLRKDGTLLDVAISLSPIRDGDGRIVGASAIARDIGERRRAEAERLARQAAEAASRAKSEFLANMSHELRSPLNTILGFARLMAGESGLPATARADLGLILKSGEHLHALIDDVLDLAKLEAGRATVNEADFDLDSLLGELRQTFAPLAAAKNLQLALACGPGVPRHIRSDPVKLRQILINLVGNALKFTPAGGISLRVEAGAAADGRQRLEFTVADSGVGIEPEELRLLFGPFAQAGAGRRQGEGSGLGLAISRGHVELLGGAMRIDSQPGCGTTVGFHLPVRVVAPPPGELRRPVLALAPGQRRYRLLVVDDRPEDRQLLVRFLAPLGFEIKEAGDGRAAIDLVSSWHPDLVWMDMRMPGLDGHEAARRIRAEHPLPPPVVVAVTASAFEEERAEMLAAGCDDFLPKPIREADLFRMLEKHLGARFVRNHSLPAPPLVPPSRLADLPADLRAALVQALLRLDTAAVERAIAAIRSREPETAAALAAWAADFRYEQLLSLLAAAPPPEEKK